MKNDEHEEPEENNSPVGGTEGAGTGAEVVDVTR